MFSIWIPLIVLLTNSATFQPSPSAEVHWIPTGCDTLSTEPLRFKIDFKIVNSGPEVAIYEFDLEAIDFGLSTRDACWIESCDAPDEWGCSIFPAEGGPSAGWDVLNELAYVAPGETLEGFSLVISSPTCCFRVQSTGPVFNIVAVDTLCADCDEPVQVLNSTWGRAKARYR